MERRPLDGIRVVVQRDGLELGGRRDDLRLALELLIHPFGEQPSEADVVRHGEYQGAYQHAQRAGDDNAIHRVHVHRGGSVRAHYAQTSPTDDDDDD